MFRVQSPLAAQEKSKAAYSKFHHHVSPSQARNEHEPAFHPPFFVCKPLPLVPGSTSPLSRKYHPKKSLYAITGNAGNGFEAHRLNTAKEDLFPVLPPAGGRSPQRAGNLNEEDPLRQVTLSVCRFEICEFHYCQYLYSGPTEGTGNQNRFPGHRRLPFDNGLERVPFPIGEVPPNAFFAP